MGGLGFQGQLISTGWLGVRGVEELVEEKGHSNSFSVLLIGFGKLDDL